MISLLATNMLTGSLLAINWLFADVENVITLVIFIIVALVSAISQYLNKKKEEAARQQRLEQQAKRAAMADHEEEEIGRRPQEPQRQFGRLPQQRPQVKPAAAPVDQDVAAEIRDFLERAATGKPIGQAPARPKPIPSIAATPPQETHRPLADRPAHRTSIEQRPIPTSHQSERPVEAKVVPQRQTLTNEDRRRAEVLRAQKQAEAKRLQAKAAQANAAQKQQASSKFDRKLGSLAKRTSRQATTPATPLTTETMAADIAAMFADTEHIRQAIVINEILTRPTHRWE